MPKTNTSTKKKAIKRDAQHFLVSYIPAAVEKTGVTHGFLDDAIGCYLDFRKEPEKLLTRNLHSEWNFHMFREAVCKVFYVQHDYDLEGRRYQVCYDTLENTNLRLPHWHPTTQVRILEHTWSNSKSVSANVLVINNDHTYTYDPRLDRWTAEFLHQPILLPEDPFGKLVELDERGIEMTSGLAWRLNNIHRLVRIQHPEYSAL